jgi:predicted GIY-YIG superfamily endonuclease
MSNKSFNGTIYKIFCLDSKIDCCYIGSTKNINRRMREHKMNVTNKKKRDERSKILAYKRSYHQNNRVEICRKRREKYKKNIEKNRIKGLAFYHLNKDKINAKRREKRIWMDGSKTSMSSNVFNHLKTEKHKSSMRLFTETLQDHLVSKFPHLSYKD